MALRRGLTAHYVRRAMFIASSDGRAVPLRMVVE